ncbi:hypothetical protein ACN27J_29170 [Solwaraspora sp. WMMB762]|uniref:hypothetical protein n=1 Tax=Solwaraspora sp. WMMB762 TaxID=3404120 RepID=UPI003B94CC42
MRLRRTLAIVTASLLAGAALTANTSAPANATPTGTALSSWNPALISSEMIYDGSVVRQRFEDGITVVAPAGSRVIFKGQVPTGEAGVTGEARVINQEVRVILPESGEPTMADAQKYAEAGRSVYADAVAAGFSAAEAQQISNKLRARMLENPPIWSSGCVYSDDVDPDPDYNWDGCFSRYVTEDSDPNNFYSTESTLASGWGTGVLGGGKELSSGYTRSFYNLFEGELVEWSPPGSLTGNNCNTFTISLTQIVGLEFGVPLCDDRWAVTKNQWSHTSDWQGGSAGGSSDTRYAANATTLRVPNGLSGVYVYQIGWSYRCFC